MNAWRELFAFLQAIDESCSCFLFVLELFCFVEVQGKSFSTGPLAA